jgi:ketopantoate reductase
MDNAIERATLSLQEAQARNIEFCNAADREALSLLVFESPVLKEIAVIGSDGRIRCNNIGSLVQDLRSGRQTETEWLHGAVVALGAQHGIAVPAHQTVLRLLRARERRCGIDPGDPVPIAALL